VTPSRCTEKRASGGVKTSTVEMASGHSRTLAALTTYKSATRIVPFGTPACGPSQ
jgi:hypothetical protein